MKKYSEFHDGFFDGVFVNGSSAHIFLSTHEGEHFVFEAAEVNALNIADFREGNIIFEVLIRTSNDLTLKDIGAVNGGFPEISREHFSKRGLESAVEKELNLLEIYPSYGATCLVLARTFELHRRLVDAPVLR